MRAVQRVVDSIMVNKASILGLTLCKLVFLWTFDAGLWAGKRVSKNMTGLEQNTQEKKLFDPLKAKAQIDVYKEIYNIGEED